METTRLRLTCTVCGRTIEAGLKPVIYRTEDWIGGRSLQPWPQLWATDDQQHTVVTFYEYGKASPSARIDTCLV